MKSILQIKNLTKKFGGLTALNDVGFEVKHGFIHGLIGPNGAGKSTMFKTLCGFYKPTGGDVIFDGVNIVGFKPSRISGLGIVRTFQETTLFQELTVLENILIGTHNIAKTNVFSAIFGLDKHKQSIAMETAIETMEFMGLQERRDQLACELPLGSQRALALAIALVSKPRLLLMDEPFAGMNPEETDHMMDLTKKVQNSGVTIMLVEHDMKAVMGLCDSITVLNFGNLLATGSPEKIRNNPEVISAYLGSSLA